MRAVGVGAGARAGVPHRLRGCRGCRCARRSPPPAAWLRLPPGPSPHGPPMSAAPIHARLRCLPRHLCTVLPGSVKKVHEAASHCRGLRARSGDLAPPCTGPPRPRPECRTLRHRLTSGPGFRPGYDRVSHVCRLQRRRGGTPCWWKERDPVGMGKHSSALECTTVCSLGKPLRCLWRAMPKIQDAVIQLFLYFYKSHL